VCQHCLWQRSRKREECLAAVFSAKKQEEELLTDEVKTTEAGH